ncbi:DNA repair protein RadA [Lachnoclostridium sp. Marseille-P6806]|uniref:DNA repair protein RadA n=1 Tax=Lachnoclostridium sp. Marseille-P6806 TaxID=2364793 RepID=UPI001030744B|nr:DNA repair protein RadA [Lachnoclostridium sp. Marseille-P6806]
MASGKGKTVFFCSECGFESAKWLGQCPGCRAWNSMVEEPVRIAPAAGRTSGKGGARGAAGGVSAGGRGVRGVLQQPVTMNEVAMEEEPRVTTGCTELDRVLGGGIVRGSLVLIGGDPGIGKSTLLLQVTKNLSDAGHRILYVSGEESLRQIKLRANRIGGVGENLRFFCETELDTITEVVLKEQPELVVIDSIQTMYNAGVSSAPGSVSQVRETTGVLLRLAKENGIAVFIVGHVTKEGTVAGPRVLEHMVDTVLYFEGDRFAAYRILRGHKNRFGSTNEIGLFEMKNEGLVQVENPSEYLLSGRPLGASGSVVTCSMEGTRPMLVEVQALLCESSFGFPKRQATGTDYNRVSLLMAVLEKRLGVRLGTQDAYVSLAGGIRQSEPALDLGICLAILSSFRNVPLDDRLIAFGEVGLSGEVRAVSMAEQRVAEAAKLGFRSCILPQDNLKGLRRPENMELIGVRGLKEALDKVL